MLFRTRYNVLFRQFRLLTAQAGSIPAAIRLIFENCYKHGDKTYTVIREADYYWWIDNNMKRVYQRIVYCAYCNVQISCENFVY